jgi:two-component system response regulator DesR
LGGYAGASGLIRVVLAEDQNLVLGAMAALLELEGDIRVIAQCADGKQALETILREQPDVLVSDIEMPHMTGLDLAQTIRERGLPIKVMILTTFARPGYLRRALDAGVQGYLLKDAPSERLAKAIREIHAGRRAIDPELAMDAWTEACPLTEREREALRHAETGLGNREIADRMCLSPGTVRNYLSEAIGKLDVANRIEAARLARQKGWL